MISHLIVKVNSALSLFVMIIFLSISGCLQIDFQKKELCENILNSKDIQSIINSVDSTDYHCHNRYLIDTIMLRYDFSEYWEIVYNGKQCLLDHFKGLIKNYSMDLDSLGKSFITSIDTVDAIYYEITTNESKEYLTFYFERKNNKWCFHRIFFNNFYK